MMNKYELKEKFQAGLVTVVFEKVDGSERTLKGTLLAEYMPERSDTTDEEKKPRAENPDVLAVWDIENNGFRSFRVDSVKKLIVG